MKLFGKINTEIFCFAPHDTPRKNVPSSILHPKRIAKGVRAGVRDYGNRIGVPTVNGAIIFDERYLGNPLVYCGTVYDFNLNSIFHVQFIATNTIIKSKRIC